MSWLYNSITEPDARWYEKAVSHQAQLTKPPGSLGILEDVAVRLSAMQQTLSPSLEQVAIRIFAADHGVVNEGVSAFPQTVTVEMIRNFNQGGAAISVLAKSLAADFAVVNMGTANPAPEGDAIVQCPVAAGTQNFCSAPAMTSEQLNQALKTGADIADQLQAEQTQLFIGGEMGIGNTTSAAAIICALLSLQPEAIVGRGTGVDEAGWQRKVDTVASALRLHQPALADQNPVQVLECVGGFEIAALAGCYLRCAQLGIPSLVDGFICSAAALLATRINPECAAWLFFSHQSAEAGHGLLLETMQATPLLQLNLRLGEGSGAAVALPLLRLACDLHNGMASFAEAGVSQS